MEIFACLAVIAQEPDPGCQIGIVGNDRAGFSEGAQVFSRIKTETAGDAQRAGVAALVESAVSLASVLDNRDTVLGSNFEERAHVSHLTEQMNRNNGFRSSGNGILELSRIQ